ncbi:MAG: arylsulfatase [Gemmataceae bacterium]
MNATLCSIRFPLFLLAILAAFTSTALPSLAAEPKTGRPNILLIVADDMGFSDAGCYGGEIATPHLDSLARNGLRYTQFYNTARCWPSRAAILTGYYAQQVRRDTVPGIKSGTQGTRPGWARLLPEFLKGEGYRSYHSGKWHVDGLPLKNGFDHSYSLNDHDRHFAPKAHTQDDKALPAVDPKSGYYSSTAIADHAIRCLKEHAESYSNRPFFEFLAFTSPHFPLQAPAEDVARYRGKYKDGWDAMREERWKRIQSLNMKGTSLSALERDLGPPYPFPDAMKKLGPNELNRPVPWKTLKEEQKTFQADKMAVHAAMVDRMDREIGRVIAQLKAMNALENTLVLFLSDNGASAEIMVRGDGHDPDAECGTGATFLSIGPGWSSLANTPFRRHKTWVHEGGISTPFIVHWPAGIAAKGEMRHEPGHIVDIVPTILELAHAKKPERIANQDVPPAPGKSLVPSFAKEGTIKHDSIWWLHEGNRALRVGDWKIVAAGKDSPWELYDMSQDRSETNNLASGMPDKVKELAAIWQKQFDENVALAKRNLPATVKP